MSKLYTIEICEEELEVIREALAMLHESKRLDAARVDVVAKLLDKNKKEVEK